MTEVVVEIDGGHEIVSAITADPPAGSGSSPASG